MKPAEASTTAKVIAASTLLLASDPRTAALVAHGAAPLCQMLLSSKRSDRWLAASAVFPLTRAIWRCVERLTLPGIMVHYWHRKRWIEHRCRDAIAAGYERAIVLGAGFDTLGLRLANELPHIEIIEIDHPATQEAKRQALAGRNFSSPSPISFIAHDLSAEPLAAALPNDGKDTVVIAEGVLMYLPPSRVAELFDALHGMKCARMLVLFSFMSTWPDGRSGFRPYSFLIEKWLAWREEAFTWAIAPQGMPAYLAEHRFRLIELALTGQFSAPSSISNASLEGENLVACERM